MKKIMFSLFADDDSNFVRAIADDLKYIFLKHSVQFEICMGIDELKNNIIPNCKEKELQIAILDLWFIDKDKNENNEDEGFEIFKKLRNIWPNCYVIFLSNHLNNGVQKRISGFKNIAIFEKTISTSKLLDEIDGILKSINL